MAQLTNIVHENKIVEKKLNYLRDYYQYCSKRIGDFPNIPLSLPTALLGNVIFQIENNAKWCRRYVINYLEQFIELHTDFIMTYEEYADQMNNFLSFIPNDVNTLQSNVIIKSDFLCSIHNLKSILSDYSIRIYFSLCTYMCCKHELDHHQKEINYCIHIVISYLKFKGYSEKEMDRVMDDTIFNNTKDSPYATLEFGKDDLFTLKDLNLGYLEKGGLFRQLSTFVKAIGIPKRRIRYFVLIDGLSDSWVDDFDVLYSKVHFVSPNHHKVKQIQEAFKDDMSFKRLVKFDEADFIISYTEIETYNRESGFEEAKKMIKTELNYINTVLESNATVNEQYIISSDNSKKYQFTRYISQQDTYSLNKSDITKLHNNPYRSLENINSEAKSTILYLEEKHSRSQRLGSIVELWAYLENLLSLSGISIKEKGKYLAKILAIEHKKRCQNKIKFDIINYLIGFGTRKIESKLSQNQIQNINANWETINITEYEEYIQSPLVRQLYLFYHLYSKPDDNIKAQKFYKSILTEAYELRNMMQRHGDYKTENYFKINRSFPNLVYFIRVAIITEIKNRPDLPIKDILSNLQTKEYI